MAVQPNHSGSADLILTNPNVITIRPHAQVKILEEVPAAFLFQYEDIYGLANRIEYNPPMDEQIFAGEVQPRR